VERGDKVALISNNRVEWATAMYAVTGIGAQLVPMYEAQLEADWKFIINDSDAKMALVANERIYDKVSTYIGNVGKLESVLSFDCDEQFMHSYHRWMKLVENEPEIPVVSLRPSEISTIIYTSGTTGKPKGVELSNDNVVSNLRGLDHIWQDEMEHNTSLAFLPWSHVFGQTAELHSLLALGSSLGIVSKREEILEALPMIKPTVVMSVPILFNKIYDGVMKKVNEGSPVAKTLFHKALAISRERNHMLEFGEKPSAWLNFKHSIADKVVLSKIRDRLGGRLRTFAAGGAATSLTVLQFFEDIGIPICEGYGLTETSPVIACGANDWETRRLGCVGVPLYNNIVRIIDPNTLEERPLGEEGEIVQAGPNVMVRYRNNEDANNEVFFQSDGHRFFRTGDLGRMVDGKFLQVTGRIKEQFKLENGKYVVPAPLEDAITRSQFIAQCFMHGDNKPFTAVLVVPDPIEMVAWGASNGFDGMPLEELVKEQKLVDFIHQELVSACGVLKAYERPKKFALIGTPFSPDNQLLTAKLSMRRNNILKEHGDLVESLFTGGGGHEV
jgi:long-chain acyl-CoA synthetase